ncbi:hypothetical protein DSO57_1036679 [Entomophthora muscae]|uniref:Uncharacterized protein n=1 Tax=Entomophthora muscae TaxID=34485 RepID=A0ACC2S1A7_9FUNG|nr:hypothetical protein DSO57_1036679 [Entomophthora muscae]
MESQVARVEMTREEEKQLVKRMDLRLIPFLALLFVFSFLDRVNIGHARIYGLETALNLTPSQYSWALSIFFIGYVMFEVPSNLMMKKTSPRVWIARIMVTWGMVTMCLAAVTDYRRLFAARFFLGVAEAGLFPGIVFILSFWYTRQEQGVRLAYIFCASMVAGVVGGFAAYGIKYMDGTLGLAAWQWIFVLEGLPTVVLGVVTWFALPDTPMDATWLNEKEKRFINQRLKDSFVDVEVKKIQFGHVLVTLRDYKTFLYMLCNGGCCTCMYALALLMPTIVNSFGFSPVKTMILTIPPYAIAFLFSLAVAAHSDYKKERGYHIVACSLFASVCFLLLVLLKTLVQKYILLIFVTSGTGATLSIVLSWSNNNLMSSSTVSATSSALVTMAGNTGAILAGQLYYPSDGPIYTVSHLACMSLHLLTISTALILRYCLAKENTKLSVNDDSAPSFNREIGKADRFRFIL